MTSELVERAQRGDHEAFDALASAAYHRLYAIARRILRDGYAAEDAVQDALVRAWRDLRGLRDRDRFDAWLHRLLVNACKDQVRQRRRRPIEVPVLSIDHASGEDRLAHLVDRDELERMFLQLPVEQRAALVLTHYVGLSAPEVAAILGIPAGTVYSRLHYGSRAHARPDRAERRDAVLQSGAGTMSEFADRMLAEWVREGPDRGPTEGVRRALAATHRTPQRPGWTIPERWLPMQLAMRPALNPRPFLLVLMAALLAIVAVGALLLAGSPQRPAPPTGLAGNGAIVTGVNSELWLANADGSAPHRLDIGLGESGSPAFSPDGTTFVLDAINPVWSPDGRFLAYSVTTTGGFVVDVNDQTKRVLIPRAFSDCGIGWAPDATALLGLDAECTGLYRIPLADPRAATRIGLPEGPIDNATWQRTAPYSGTER